jgi:hypothetical protein
MLPPLPGSADQLLAQLTTVEVAAPTVIFLVAFARLQFGSVVFSPRHAAVWNTIRKVAAPILQRLIYRTTIPNVEVENEAVKEEYVGVVDLSAQELIMRVDGERDVEIPLLAGFKVDWDGNKESGTAVWYCGKQPVGFPKWLKPYQVHFFAFRVGGKTRICAHFEANPWRPDLWFDHLFKGDSFSAPKGVQRMKRALADADVPLHNEELEV